MRYYTFLLRGVGGKGDGEDGTILEATKSIERYSTAYCLLRSLVEHSYINPKSLTFGYLDENPIDTDLMKFLSLCPSAMSWYLEFAFAFSISSAPFTTNALPPREQGIDDSTEVPPLGIMLLSGP
ncbi:hypothetical protein BHM03_00022133 [Ensete ventricosum]|nr:hypothetical protein BHM03_00022133 [Ensete ventricosum]